MLKIIAGYKGMIEYIREARENPGADLTKLWLRHVINPYWDDWAAGQFNEERTRGQLCNPITELDRLAPVAERLNHSEIDSIIEHSYRQMTQILPPPESDKAICIYADPYLGENVGGVVGSCIGDNILIQINAAFSGWEAIAPWVLAHEYHHTVWGYNYFYIKGHRQADLLTSLISDGQADSFAKALNAGMNVPWTKALSGRQEQEQWNIMQEYLCSADEETYRRFFFGDHKTGTPGSTAYTVGFHIVQRYLKEHPGISFVELMDKTAYEILADSKYGIDGL